jgi:hypothetical protein
MFIITYKARARRGGRRTTHDDFIRAESKRREPKIKSVTLKL